MSVSSVNNPSLGKLPAIGSQQRVGDLYQYIPEPRSRLGLSFQGALRAVGRLASDVVGGAIGSPALGSVPGEYQTLIHEQIRVQQEMQVVSFVSNIEKSRHETRMAAVRNVRAG